MEADTKPAFEVLKIGRSQEPVVIIDGFSANPDALAKAAASMTFEDNSRYYPGIRAACDPDYLGQRADVLKQVLIDVFGADKGAVLVECNYSLVTTSPEDLAPIQRLPHYDSTDPKRLAVLHYLCGPEGGGTAFYRHRATGHEYISQGELHPYSKLLQKEFREIGAPQQDYIRSSNDQFEQIGWVDAAYNRLVMYRGWRLHSGLIPAGLTLSDDPAKGRLTINTFLQAR